MRSVMSQAPENQQASAPGGRAATPTHAGLARAHRLQRAVGNQAMLRSAGSRILPKLRIGAASDPLEREADATADAVMEMRAAPRLSSSGAQAIQRKCAGCDEEEVVRMKPAPGGPTSDLAAVFGAGGAPLPDAERRFFEPRFGHDFGSVRIHTDAGTGTSARAINALAYTQGADIGFAPGRFRPGTSDGRRLLAHELAHVVQNGEARSQSVVRRYPDPRLETELATLRALGPTLHGHDPEEAMHMIFRSVEGIDLADPDNLAPISQVLGEVYDREIMLAFLSQVELRTRERARSRHTRDIERMMRVQGSPYLGPGGVGLFPYMGAAASGIATAAQQIVDAGDAFLGGLADGLRSRVGASEARDLIDRLNGATVLSVIFPIPLAAGATVGIIRDVIDTIRGVIDIVGNFSEIAGHIADVIREVMRDPAIARVMGFETGQHFGDRLVTLSHENVVVFAYHLGEIVGPTVFWTVVSLLGLPEIAGAIIFRRLAYLLRRFPRIAAILELIAARLHPHAGLRPHVPEPSVPEPHPTAPHPSEPHPHATDPHATPPEPHAGGPHIPTPLAGSCRLGSLFCSLTERILEHVPEYPTPERCPRPTGEMRIRGLNDPEYLRLTAQRTPAFMQGLYLSRPDLWTPEFRAAYEAAGRTWPRVGGRAWQVHHKLPLSWGGDNSVLNFVALEPAVHSTYTTWWTAVRNHIAESFTDADWRALVGGARDATLVP